MINVLNKWNGMKQYTPQMQPKPQQKPPQKTKPKPKEQLQPSTMDFLNTNLYNNFRRPFE